jgi:hypothetical protein
MFQWLSTPFPVSSNSNEASVEVASSGPQSYHLQETTDNPPNEFRLSFQYFVVILIFVFKFRFCLKSGKNYGHFACRLTLISIRSGQ